MNIFKKASAKKKMPYLRLSLTCDEFTEALENMQQGFSNRRFRVADGIDGYFLIEKADHYEDAIPEDFPQPLEELKEIALINTVYIMSQTYDGAFPLKEYKECETVEIPFNNKDFYATLMLLQDFWEKGSSAQGYLGIEGNVKFAVVAPFRSVLAFGNADNPKCIEKLKEIVKYHNEISVLLNPETDEEIAKSEKMTQEDWEELGIYDTLAMFEYRRKVSDSIYIYGDGKWNKLDS